MLGEALSSMRPLGQGAYARVRLVKHAETGDLLAIKTVRIKTGTLEAEEHNQIEIECQTHKRLNHPNIIKLHDYSKEGNFFELLLEYADQGDCSKLLRQRGKLSEQQSLGIIFQIAKGLEYLHGLGVLHRDIKLENVLGTSSGMFKICDFGWCSPPSDAHRNIRCGTYEYMAPEVASQQQYSSKIDMWSLGILAFELVHGTTPFRAPDAGRILANIAAGEFDIDPLVTQPYRRVLEGLLKTDPNRRLSATQLLALPIFREVSVEYERILTQKTIAERQKYVAFSRDWEKNQLPQDAYYIPTENSQTSEERPIDKLLRKLEMMEKGRDTDIRSDHNSAHFSTSSSRIGQPYTPIISSKPNPDAVKVEPLIFGENSDNVYRGKQKRNHYTLLDRTGYVEINPDINTWHMAATPGQQEAEPEEPKSPGLLDSLFTYIRGWVEELGTEQADRHPPEPELRVRTLAVPERDPALAGHLVAGPATRPIPVQKISLNRKGVYKSSGRPLLLSSRPNTNAPPNDFDYD